MAPRTRSSWTSSVVGLAASAGGSYALAASLGVHALLVATVALLPPPVQPAAHAVQRESLELLPLPEDVEPNERGEPRAAALPALDREGPPQRNHRVRALRPRASAAPAQAGTPPPPLAAPATSSTAQVSTPAARELEHLPPPAAAPRPDAPAPLAPVEHARSSASAAARGSAPEVVYDEADVDRAPRLLVEPRPQYPALALRQEYEGDVVLALLVDASGRVREASVTRRAGRGFDEAALAAARQLRFQPGSKLGRNVPVRVTWTCRFRLE